MPNKHIFQRLAGIQQMLGGVCAAGGSLSAATKGGERAAFIDNFLREVLPTPFRFGSGDATDHVGARSGQLDVVVEYPFTPSLPIVGADSSRLYLAESVAAVVEIKSDVSAQWKEVLRTAEQLAPLSRSFGAQMIMGPAPAERIPLFAIGYRGWAKMETLVERLDDGPVDGILVIDRGLFASTPDFRGIRATNAWSLWGLICSLHQATSTLKSASTNPLRYAQD